MASILHIAKAMKAHGFFNHIVKNVINWIIPMLKPISFVPFWHSLFSTIHRCPIFDVEITQREARLLTIGIAMHFTHHEFSRVLLPSILLKQDSIDLFPLWFLLGEDGLFSAISFYFFAFTSALIVGVSEVACGFAFGTQGAGLEWPWNKPFRGWEWLRILKWRYVNVP